jgi:Flp pilus assembly protein TadD
LKAAELAFEQATALDDKNNEAWRMLGLTRALKGDSDAAIASYQLWAKHAPNDARIYVGLGELYDQRGNWQSAQSFYYQAIRLDPDNPFAANNLAFSLLEHGGDATQALNYAVAARTQLPDSPTTADTIGWAYFHKGVYKEAASSLESAAAALPDNPSVHYHLGLTYKAMHDMTRAKQHLEKVLQLDPQYSHAQQVYKALQELVTTG